MVSTLILFIVLFFSCLSYAGDYQVARLHMFSGGELTASTACTGTCEIGYSTADADQSQFIVGYIYCIRATASANGTLTGANAQLYSYDNLGATGQVGLYANPDGVADPDDCTGSECALLSKATGFNDVAGGWVSVAMDTGVAITSGTKYFICVLSTGANYTGVRTITNTEQSYYGDSGLSDLPASLDLTGPYTLQTNYYRAVFVEIK